ncbi:hypothetical protein OC624_09840 [Bacillus altitudinis]|nr:hypothetical protein [Bacillus altitudinis]
MRNDWLDLFRHYGLVKLSDYAEHVESTLNHQLVEIDRYIDTFETVEEKEYYVDRIYDEIAAYSDDFPAIMRASLLISIYSYLEHELNKLCRFHNAEGFLIFKTKATGIARSKEFMKKELKMDFPDQTKEWNFICYVKEIRNCFAHAQGHIDMMSQGLQDKVRQAIKSLGKGLISEKESTKEIQLHEKFNEEFIKNAKKFLDYIYEEIKSPRH